MLAESQPIRLNEEARSLVAQLVSNYDEVYGVGTMSCAVYDTAWVAMVAKTINGQTKWLFPESFEYLMVNQRENGGWDSYAAQVDGILNTLAGLLAFKKHLDKPELSSTSVPGDLSARIQRATDYARTILNDWDVESTIHVGFEILVPAMLNMLEQEGISFGFSGKELLMSINRKKLARFHPSILYSPMKISAVHSLEAFIGQIDFDKVKHHKTFGSMMASPSSTAAYLIHSSTWDDESEAYLKHVISAADGKGSGGVPSAFPSTYFEYTWIVCTLMKGGFKQETLGVENLGRISQILESALKAENGCIGFAPMVGADADDTAMSLITLNLLGTPYQADRMIEEFEAPNHFRTYSMERNPSLSANCNVLNALLHCPKPDEHIKQIEKGTRFLCEEWWHVDGQLEDKWNLTEQYPIMLLVQSLTRLLHLWEAGELPSLSQELLQDRVIIVLYQALIRTLKAQDASGSWANGYEATSYAIIALANLSSLPFSQIIRPQIDLAIEKGREMLKKTSSNSSPEHLWIEKVTYGSASLAKAYLLSALNISTPTYAFGEKVSSLALVNTKAVQKFAQFFGQLPLYSKTPQWLLQASVVEGYLFFPMIQRRRLEIFPRQGMEKDKYLEYIPFTWTGANNRDNVFMNANYLYEMMVLSMLTYQADEYMEAVVGRYYSGDMDDVVKMIDDVFNILAQEHTPIKEEETTKETSSSNGVTSASKETHSELKQDVQVTKSTEVSESHDNMHPTSSDAGSVDNTDESWKSDDMSKDHETDKASSDSGYGSRELEPPSKEAEDVPTTKTQTLGDNESQNEQGSVIPTLDEVAQPLKKFVQHVLYHPKVQSSSQFDQARLKRELKIYLLAHLTQVNDNVRFGTQNLSNNSSVPFETPESSYYTWVQSISADHTSCPFAFAFVSCLLSKEGKDCFSSAEEKYVAEDLCRHLAVTCRQYNDYGSLARDRDEKNVNSINFPEFFWAGNTTTDQSLKDELYQIAMYEKMKLDMAISSLESICVKNNRRSLAEAVKMFVNVTDTYGQIYIIRDIASRM